MKNKESLPSKGKIFKTKMGFSKTQKRLMDKKGLAINELSLEYLRVERKEIRDAKADIRKEKHTTSKAKRKSGK